MARGLGRFHRDQPGDCFGGWLRVLTRRQTCDYHRRGHPIGVGGSAARVALGQVPDAFPGEDATDVPTAEVVRRGLVLIRG